MMSLPLIKNRNAGVLWAGVFGRDYTVDDVEIFYEVVCDKLKNAKGKSERKRFRQLKHRIEIDVYKSQIVFYEPHEMNEKLHKKAYYTPEVFK